MTQSGEIIDQYQYKIAFIDAVNTFAHQQHLNLK